MRNYSAPGLILLVAWTVSFASVDPDPSRDATMVEAVPGLRFPEDPVLREALLRKVNPPAVQFAALNDFLLFYADRYSLKFEVDEKGFTQAGIDRVLQRELRHPQVNQLALHQALRDLVGQVRGEVRFKGDTIIVVPAKR
jgi:hypothetical protein